MRPLVVVVGHELGHSLSQVLFADEHDTIEAFLLDRSNKPLRMGIGVWCPIGRLDHVEACVAQQLPHGHAPLRVAVAEQHPVMGEQALIGEDETAGHLQHEARVWVAGGPEICTRRVARSKTNTV